VKCGAPGPGCVKARGTVSLVGLSETIFIKAVLAETSVLSTGNPFTGLAWDFSPPVNMSDWDFKDVTIWN